MQFINSKETLVTEAIDGLIRTSGGTLARLDGYPHIRVVVRADWDRSKVALVSGGGGLAWLGWRKPGAEAKKIDAEADKIKAETEELIWGHMKETIERLQKDVQNLLDGRKDRDARIGHLEDAIKACTARENAGKRREKALARRITMLEKAVAGGVIQAT